MKTSRWTLATSIFLFIIGGWAVLSYAQPIFSTGSQEEGLFEVVYQPFPQRSPKDLAKAVQALPPTKPGRVLPVEQAERYLPFKLRVAQCLPVEGIKLQGVKIIQETYPDGKPAMPLYAQVIYDLKGETINLIEYTASQADSWVGPNGSKEITIRNNQGSLFSDAETGLIDIQWFQGTLFLRLAEMKNVISTQDLIQMAECVQ